MSKNKPHAAFGQLPVRVQSWLCRQLECDITPALREEMPAELHMQALAVGGLALKAHVVWCMPQSDRPLPDPARILAPNIILAWVIDGTECSIEPLDAQAVQNILYWMVGATGLNIRSERLLRFMRGFLTWVFPGKINGERVLLSARLDEYISARSEVVLKRRQGMASGYRRADEPASLDELNDFVVSNARTNVLPPVVTLTSVTRSGLEVKADFCTSCGLIPTNCYCKARHCTRHVGPLVLERTTRAASIKGMPVATWSCCGRPFVKVLASGGLPEHETGCQILLTDGRLMTRAQWAAAIIKAAEPGTSDEDRAAAAPHHEEGAAADRQADEMLHGHPDRRSWLRPAHEHASISVNAMKVLNCPLEQILRPDQADANLSLFGVRASARTHGLSVVRDPSTAPTMAGVASEMLARVTAKQ